MLVYKFCIKISGQSVFGFVSVVTYLYVLKSTLADIYISVHKLQSILSWSHTSKPPKLNSVS